MKYLAAIIAFIMLGGTASGAEDQKGLFFEVPRLVIDTGQTTGGARISASAEAGVAVSGGDDKALRVWGLEDGSLRSTIWVPRGPGNTGLINAVAISPDGRLLAAGGWTGPDEDGPHSIYLFDAGGEMVGRIPDLPSVVLALAFSPDGDRLAATLGQQRGLRVFSRKHGWAESLRDDNYLSDSYGVTYAPDGRIATSAVSGATRIYEPGSNVPEIVGRGFSGSFGLAFNPDGTSLAVGSIYSGRVAIHDTRRRIGGGPPEMKIQEPRPSGYKPEHLAFVSWSADGETLLAAGSMRDGEGRNSVLALHPHRPETSRVFPVSHDTIMGLAALPGGRLLAVAGDPWIGVIGADGDAVWERRAEQIHASGMVESLAVSEDGMKVGFIFGRSAPERMLFDLESLELTGAREPMLGLSTPDQTGIDVRNWDGTNRPEVNGIAIALNPREFSRSIAADSERGRIVLGSDWHLAAYDTTGEVIWRRTAPSVAWAVNIAAEGRIAVVAYGDGSIRWHDIENNGVELLSLWVTRTAESYGGETGELGWVVWTPEGLYESTDSSFDQLVWHVNRGADAAASVHPASAIAGTNRPDVIPHVVPSLGSVSALGGSGARTLKTLFEQVQIATAAHSPPGAWLHVLTVGVSDLGDQAENLRLEFAARDAEDLALRLRETQQPLYSGFRISYLTDAEASAQSVLDSLDTLRTNMSRIDGSGRDFAVIHFSGHGMYKDGRYYLLTHGSDARRPNSIAATALDLELVADKIREISKLGRVLVLIDACRSNAYAADSSPLEANADYLKHLIYGDQVAVFMSSSPGEVSWERDDLENGVFTEAVLDALSRSADSSRDRMISTTEFINYVEDQVRRMTGGRQVPSFRIAYNQSMFFAARE